MSSFVHGRSFVVFVAIPVLLVAAASADFHKIKKHHFRDAVFALHSTTGNRKTTSRVDNFPDHHPTRQHCAVCQVTWIVIRIVHSSSIVSNASSIERPW